MSSQENNQITRKPPAGFNKHPENINRKGRPKKEWTWAALLEDAAEEMEIDEKGNKIPVKKIAAKKLMEKVKQGDVQAFNAVADRMEGKAVQGHEHTGADGEAILVTVKYE